MLSLHIDTARTWRGGQRQVMFTVLGLRALGHRTVLVAHPQGELMRRMAEGLDLVPLAPRAEIDLAAAWRLSRVLKGVRPEVVHAHDPHAVAMGAVALSMTSLSPRPAFLVSRRIEYRLARNSFSRWKYSQVDGFLAISEAVRAQLLADGIPRHKTAVVHEGVDVERVVKLPAASVHAELYLPTHSPVVGTVGALVSQKGQDHLIDAAALVLPDVPDARFVIVGDGELRESLEHHVRHKHLERHVFLTGFRTDALELTKSFDIFALSSLNEGMCTALLDAMAASKPTVATAVGGVPEVVADGETGFLVPARDHRAMAEKIGLLLRDAALREAMGRAALRRVRERFTVERMVEETLAAYRGRRR